MQRWLGRISNLCYHVLFINRTEQNFILIPKGLEAQEDTVYSNKYDDIRTVLHIQLHFFMI